MKNTLLFTALLLAALFGSCVTAEDKPGEPKQESTTTTTTSGATTPAVSAAPKFPIVSENFKTIEDGNDHPEDGMPDAANLNSGALVDIIAALRSSSLDDLKANVDRTAEFKKLFNHPENYRGHVVQFESTLKFTYDHSQTVKDDKGTVYTLARGHVSSSWQLITFLSLEPLPKDMKIGDSVMITGIFMQRFAYINSKMPGKQLTWTPLIIVKCVEPFTPVEAPATNPIHFLGYLIFALVLVGLGMVYAYREKGKAARNNVFRSMRIEREGKDRQFRGPSAKPNQKFPRE